MRVRRKERITRRGTAITWFFVRFGFFREWKETKEGGVHMRSVMILELLSSHWTDFAVFGVHRLPCFIMSFKSLGQILVY